MSEPRKLNTGDAQRTVYHAGDAQRSIRTSGAAGSTSSQQLEEARRRARMAAADSSRRSRQFTPVQPADVQRYQAARQAQAGQSAPAPFTSRYSTPPAIPSSLPNPGSRHNSRAAPSIVPSSRRPVRPSPRQPSCPARRKPS